VSNPPYVLAEEIETLEPEVREWEPRVALVGRVHTHLVAEHAAEVLPPGGRLVLEVAGERGAEVVDLLEQLGYDDVRLTLDLAGSDRVVEGVRR
jgi:release factor glutamine methyltransferase